MAELGMCLERPARGAGASRAEARALTGAPRERSACLQRVGERARLRADDPVVLGDHQRKLGRREPRRPDPLEVLVGRPTGDGAALSDEDGNLVVDEFREELP